MHRSNVIRLHQRAWHEDDILKVEFPSSWDVNVCQMQGHDSPPLIDTEMRRAFQNPIGTRPIRELARGKKEVVIAFDDMTRPTRAAKVLPYVLEELQAAQIPDDNIRFVSALGAHSAMAGTDFKKKLGQDILDRFAVYNHNCYENCTYLGTTTRGTPLSVNSDFMSCDLKIGVGFISPHPRMGFGGGGKLVLPGLAHIDSMIANHSLPRGDHAFMGNIEGNQIAEDAAEAAKMAGLDFKIDTVVNSKLEIVALFVGDPVLEHQEGVKLAKEHYATEPIEGADIVVANTYAKANECIIAREVAAPLLQHKGGDLVLITNTPEGQVIHYLFGHFGKLNGGTRFTAISESLPPGVRRLTIMAPYVDRASERWFGPPGSVIWKKTWPDVLSMLIETYGTAAKVAVLPDGTMQYFPKLRALQLKNRPSVSVKPEQ